jgi:class 3 adenylate cyclase
MLNVRQWLSSLDLEQYAEAFEANAIDGDLLSLLDDADLEKIGVQPLGHRKRLLKEIGLMNAVPGGTPHGPSAENVEPRQVPIRTGVERRQLAVMFCDLVGSTTLSEKIDPEELREVLSVYQSTVSKAVGPYAGFIARFMGDGLLIYFGYPKAHEDDAERAVRAGLQIIQSVSELRSGFASELQVRIGVATGLVVAGDIIGTGASEEHAVLGDTPNLASRLQSIALPNSIGDRVGRPPACGRHV